MYVVVNIQKVVFKGEKTFKKSFITFKKSFFERFYSL
jgi:hypothetical protein